MTGHNDDPLNSGTPNSGEATAGTTMDVDEHEPAFHITGTGMHDGREVVNAVTYYGEKFKVRADATSEDNMTSTTVGDADTEDMDTNHSQMNESAASSSSDSQVGRETEVGFFRHGQWHARARTPEEQRQHVGGKGPARQRKRQERLNSYFHGKWKPAWLLGYIRDRELRSQRPTLRGRGGTCGFVYTDSCERATASHHVTNMGHWRASTCCLVELQFGPRMGCMELGRLLFLCFEFLLLYLDLEKWMADHYLVEYRTNPGLSAQSWPLPGSPANQTTSWC
ncbi:unnamed protein product [Symbiodinium sp. CCMP2592]|nr:unnamed protein product [Symbiodinium sp. CCMP2592]